MTEQLLFQCMTGVHILNSTFKGCQTLKATTTFDSPKMSLVGVYFKESDLSPEQLLMLLKNPAILPPASRLQAKVNPTGLSHNRKQYLFREFRQFCKPGTEEQVAPAPQE